MLGMQWYVPMLGMQSALRLEKVDEAGRLVQAKLFHDAGPDGRHQLPLLVQCECQAVRIHMVNHQLTFVLRQQLRLQIQSSVSLVMVWLWLGSPKRRLISAPKAVIDLAC